MTIGALLLIAQAVAAPGAAPVTPPDIELLARTTIREITIEQEAPVKLAMRADPGLTDVTVERSQPAGARAYRNLVIDARVAAWLTDTAQAAGAATMDSTGEPPQ